MFKLKALEVVPAMANMDHDMCMCGSHIASPVGSMVTEYYFEIEISRENRIIYHMRADLFLAISLAVDPW